MAQIPSFPGQFYFGDVFAVAKSLHRHHDYILEVDSARSHRVLAVPSSHTPKSSSSSPPSLPFAHPYLHLCSSVSLARRSIHLSSPPVHLTSLPPYAHSHVRKPRLPCPQTYLSLRKKYGDKPGLTVAGAGIPGQRETIFLSDPKASGTVHPNTSFSDFVTSLQSSLVLQSRVGACPLLSAPLIPSSCLTTP